jgi:peptidylprolyl isomerase
MFKHTRYSALLFLMAAAVYGGSDSDKLSEALGHMIGKNLQSLKIPLDTAAIAKGLQDEAAGLSSPMNEEQCLETLAKLEEECNLARASLFLASNQKREGVVSLQNGKLQFEILKKGTGQIVQSYNSPLIRLKIEDESADSNVKEEILPLDETIAGFKFGIVGMQEGEVRKLYIHPDLSYQERSSFPRSLLIVEVEVIEADASSDAHAASNAESLPIFRDLDDVRPLQR